MKVRGTSDTYHEFMKIADDSPTKREAVARAIGKFLDASFKPPRRRSWPKKAATKRKRLL